MNLSLTKHIKEQLTIFDRVGTAPRDRFDDLDLDRHPQMVMNNFHSIIVFVEGQEHAHKKDMGQFKGYLGTITAQSEVLNILHQNGYKGLVIGNEHQNTSLVRMGVEAGVGEISPVDSLVVKGLGLTSNIGAIITDAPLMPDEKVHNICIGCNKCLRICPIRELANQKGDLNKCACGGCRNICPV